ncbi:putative ABC transporter ATP-binding protein [Bacteroides pyogenes]|uniref:ABC transporter ATP-binding protein n=1 Tax=Bacteroides pyogenes TaxID=310300 RepID=UPI001BAB58FC|nr:ABC transporter ATP-binding protein [Bacteroides pyogenes]MBR8720115.1 putative ABC transporter ATP-binding protein [Bacteroides pyogenes]MBR8725599.1 putative ABC transporter ATP-binding protein [Bacteroides pyogenes]MBR8738846.1 putative ABC transporter ATP-binding protein [Bacteroides pyogenes]MBR8754639.1 putative ABC transporter ATP-binding protein [Bacteroides pyogenes]MBR8787996.1 putative ABC transporter ATP-binding protein [Bacteroides pyogenes]
MALIQTEKLEKTFRGEAFEVHAVANITLNIEQGEFSAIVGPSGSGKTTLLNLLGGLDHPSSGRILIDGKDIGLMKEKELIDFRLHNIGFVFQSYNLIPVFTVEENISFLMELQGYSKEERKQRTNDLLKIIGLADRARTRPANLSGGEQQRVAVARALAAKPRFVLADEPTANLDTKSAENLLNMMMRLNREENMTFIFSTHDPRIMAKANRIITLEDGRMIKEQFL